jgi:hypothetical protein
MLRVSAGRGVKAIQLRDIQDDSPIPVGELKPYEVDAPLERYAVGPGDVLFRSRGERTTAGLATGFDNQAVIAIFPVIILRPDTRKIYAEFLAWSINQPSAQRHLDSGAQGQTIRMIPKSTLEDLQIDVPDLPTQRGIVAADALAHRQFDLTIKLAGVRRQLTSVLLADKAQDGNKKRKNS